jgi:dienelactone hydrolase
LCRIVTWALAAIALCTASQPAKAAEEAFRALRPEEIGRHPAVLFVPGCSGFVATNDVNIYEERAAELQAAGYIVVFVDYVGRRMQSNCAHISVGEVSADIVDAARWAREQSDVDADRIAVIGWSYGAAGVLATLRTMSTPPVFTKAVVYYPVCRGAAPWSAPVAGLMLLGERDDIAFPNLCDTVAKGMAPDRQRTIVYPGARHGFDMRGLADTDRQAPGTPGYNADAAVASWTAVLGFLK